MKPQDCEVGEWGAWSGCSCSCNGMRTRVRDILKYPSNGGKGCGLTVHNGA